MKPLDRLAPLDRLRVLALTEAELELTRRYRRLPTEQIDALLAEEPTGAASFAWLARAQALIGSFIGQPAAEVDHALGVLARTYTGVFGDAHEIDATRAALIHLADWAALDEPSRLAALEEELAASMRRDLVLILGAARAHGFPVAAPDLQLPSRWTRAWADRHLAMLVDLGCIASSGRRRPDGWPIYVTA